MDRKGKPWEMISAKEPVEKAYTHPCRACSTCIEGEMKN
jgi:hypothetical protein